MIDARDRIVMGAPGGFALWAFDVVRTLAAMHQPAPMPVKLLDRLDVAPPLAPDSPARILLCHYPTAEMLETLRNTALSVVYLDEPAELIVNYLMKATNRDDLQAVRVCSAAYVGHVLLAQAAGVLVMERCSGLGLRDCLVGLCRHLGLDPDRNKLRAYEEGLASKYRAGATVDEAVGHGPAGVRSKIEATDPVAKPELQKLVRAILSPLRERLISETAGPIVWPTDVFFLVEPPTERAKPGTAIDLGGPARMLYHGPYLHLSPATYDVDVTLSIVNQDSENRFRIEFHAGAACIARASMCPKNSGVFKGSLRLTHANSEAEVQAQVIAEQGAIEGRLELISVAFMPDMRANARDVA